MSKMVAFKSDFIKPYLHFKTKCVSHKIEESWNKQ